MVSLVIAGILGFLLPYKPFILLVVAVGIFVVGTIDRVVRNCRDATIDEEGFLAELVKAVLVEDVEDVEYFVALAKN